MRLPSVLLALAILCIAAPARAGGGLFVPPIRLDVAPLAAMTEQGPMRGSHSAIGLHWASLSPHPSTGFDVGVGWVYQHLEAPPADVAHYALAPQPHEPAAERDVNGAYVELSKRVFGRRYQRAWIGGRAEWLYATDHRGERHSGQGVAARASYELFGGLLGGGQNGVIAGAFAVGIFGELTYRHHPMGGRSAAATAGLTIRLPLILIGS